MKREVFVIFLVIFLLSIHVTQSETLKVKDFSKLHLKAVKEKKVTLDFIKNKGYFIVQFKAPLTQEQREELKEINVKLQNYIPDNAYIVKLNKKKKRNLMELNFVEDIIDYAPEYKISPKLSKIKAKLSAKEKKVIINVLVHSDADIDEVIAKLDNIEVLEKSSKIMKIKLDKDQVDEISEIEGIEWIEEFQQATLDNDVAAVIVGANYTWVNYGLNGSGQVIAFADSGLDTGVDNNSLDGDMHLDFDNRVVSIQNWAGTHPDDGYGHGTHVAGSILGDGNKSDGKFKGMAYGASLVVQAMGGDANTSTVYPPTNLSDLFYAVYSSENGSAKFHSNSWGSSSNEYNFWAQTIDEFTWSHSDFLVLFSAGNRGSGNSDGSGGTLNTVGVPGVSKNSITVGATENDKSYKSALYADDYTDVAYFSSRGPSDDGRIKPDLVAPGTYILSTNSSVGNTTGWSWGAYDAYYFYACGTSMATPIVAGMAAIVRQYYIENKSLTPTASLIKATLINGAEDIGYGIPSNHSGWGLVNLTNSIFPVSPRNINYTNSINISTGDNSISSYYVNESSVQFKATIVWADFPSTPSASINLINNLNLVVTAPNGTKYYGNDFDAPFDDVLDNLNNVEQVIIDGPEPGSYEVNITGFNIPQGPQEVALVVSGALNSPVAYLNSPANNSRFNNGAVYLNFTPFSEINETLNCSLFFDNELNQSNESVYSGNLTSFSLNITEGEHNWSMQCDDSQNVFTSDTRFLTIDITSPAVYIESPINETNWTTSDPIVFNYNVSDNGNLANCSLILNSQINSTNTSLITQDTTQNFSLNLSDGTHNWSVNCTDDVNNIGSSNTWIINVSITREGLGLTIHGPADGYNSTSSLISFSANTVSNNTIQNISLWHNETSWHRNITNSSAVSGYYNFSQTFSQGSVKWGLEICDLLNCTVSANRTLFIDSIAPTVAILNPVNDSSLNQSNLNITLNLSFSENVDTVWYSRNTSLENRTICSNCSSNYTTIQLFSFGTNTLYVYVNDSWGNERTNSSEFSINLDSDNDGTTDDTDTDDDNDGIEDENDTFIGNVSNLNTNIPNVNITINGSANLSQRFSGLVLVKILNGSSTRVEFYYNASGGQSLIFGNITPIIQDNSSSEGSIIVKGIELQSLSLNKTVYIDKINSSSNSVCIKDKEINIISEITGACSAADETIVSCSGTNGTYGCTSTGTQFKITGLNNSGVRGFTIPSDSNEEDEDDSTATTSGGGGGGGGGAAYSTYWTDLDTGDLKTVKLKKNDKLFFNISNKEYLIVANLLKGDSVNLTIASKKISLGLSQRKSIDLNNDKLDDILIRLEKILSLTAYINIQRIERVEAIGGQSATAPTEEDKFPIPNNTTTVAESMKKERKKESDKKNALAKNLIIMLISLVFALLFVKIKRKKYLPQLRKKKKKKEKKSGRYLKLEEVKIIDEKKEKN